MPVCMHETGPRKKEAFPTPTESFILEGGNIYLVFNASCHQKHPPTEWLNFLQQTHDSNYPSRSSGCTAASDIEEPMTQCIL